MNLQLIAVIIAAAFISGSGVGFGACKVWKDGQIAQLELESAREIIEANLEARDAVEQRIAAVTKAQDAAAASVRVVAAERRDTDAAGGGLRIATADTVQAAREDSAACASQAETLGIVFDQCSARLIEVATDADLWVIEVERQNQAAQ